MVKMLREADKHPATAWPRWMTNLLQRATIATPQAALRRLRDAMPIGRAFAVVENCLQALDV